MTQTQKERDELLSTLKAIRARIKGEWDNDDLMAKGPLMPTLEDDILIWTQQAIAKVEGR